MYKYIYWFKRRLPQRYKPVILVTGCASGIGLALADLFHSMECYRVVVTARRSRLKELQERYAESDRFKILELDVTSELSRKNCVHHVFEMWGRVDILINNAGISYRAVVEHMSEDDEIHQMSVNYFGPMALTRLVLPRMRERGRGKIINVSSVSGMLAMPTMASYSASKYALEGASEALWYEAKPFGVDVALIQPGFIHSDSFEKVHRTSSSRFEENYGGPYEDLYRSMSPFVAKLMGISITTPQRVADLVLSVIQTIRPPLWVPATLDAEFFYYLRRWFPRRLLHPFLFWCLPRARSWGKKYTNKRSDAPPLPIEKKAG